GLGALTEDDMTDERLALGREVGAEVRAATLRPHDRALRDQPGQQMRRRSEPLEAGSIPDQSAVAPEPPTQRGSHGLRPRGVDGSGPAWPQTPLAEGRDAR